VKGPAGTPAPQGAVARLIETVRRLRAPDGCPWDREQTHASLKPFLLEECHELMEAIDSGDTARMSEELGDVLLQVALHAQLLNENETGSFDSVAEIIADKLVRRHPHVFADASAADSSEVTRNWEAIKSAESDSDGNRRRILEGVPASLPALQRAQRVQSRAARVGFDWERHEDVTAKVDEELRETVAAIESGVKEDMREEIGDLLFAVTNLARFHGIQAEEALHGTTAKFTRRLQEVERRVRASGRELSESTLEEMDGHWKAVKREERGA